MTDDISAALSWFANYTNFYTVLSVLLCFVAMVVFILRLNGENFMSSSATHYVTVREQSMMKLHNPFSVQLDRNHCSSLKDGLHLRLSMEQTSKAKILWGVNIQTFQTELQKSSNEIAQRFDTDTIFEANFKESQTLGLISQADCCKTVYVKCPGEVTEEVLGEPPRVTYPVVVVTCLDSQAVSSEVTKIVVQFTVIHLKDSFCNLDSHIVYQFVKTNFNKIISLQPIFMSTTEENTPKDVSRNMSERTCSNQPDMVTQHASVGQGQTDQGHLLNDSTDGFQHCDFCGKLQHCLKNIPKTREHETCTCEHQELCDGTEQGDEKLDNEKYLSQGNDNRPEMLGNDVDDKDTADESGINSLTEAATGDENCSNEDEEELCCVCQSLNVFYALLPCRHACVCRRCFTLIDKCPICRALIESYFRISDRYQAEESRTVEEERDNMGPRLNRWQAFNQRLNEILGFT